ncbi:uncharacterized protein BT62DRAFT_935557 [Guyanagaster necrorhizus]|uniref:SCD domain-containing protein n=1 Tax=Guyanagaster necrorhizus TaxID=856835 RepID=A0A9P7VLM5_9AGAR|nr:uncharacterized protein BT62DRAFT_935557 [Guyanagaster necrorhizus MCA 3950]KAG7442823.1 hypothetical protein BT62DRAFT_935557 [Guyanagaster necrorhizus MCA 3950]
MDSSQNESPAAPRRSQRDRKQPKRIDTITNIGKRKRTADSDADEDAEAVEEDAAEEYHAPKPKPARKVMKPAAKKPRTQRGRKIKDPDDALFDPEQLAKDTKINSDNPLYNAIMNPSAALQGTAEDFLESLQQQPGPALAELINLILRSCGCNDSVDEDQAVDYDGVVDALDHFTEGLKQEASPTYPLTSKNPIFKKFRTHLSEFFARLISSAADLGVLYTSDLIPTLQTWVVAMSSSQIRSFRHTSTAVALDVEAALCDVTRGVEKEVEVLGRQREGEKKRRAKGGASAKDKELEGKLKEVKGRAVKLDEFLKEFIDGVFVHRFRDLDPVIRTECITSLGIFFKKHPSHFLSTSYLRYVGWVLSDSATHARLAAVKALQIVYSSSVADGVLTSLNHFTERFKPRLVEMAEADVDVGVRVGVLNVLEEIEKSGMLEEEERERLGGLVFCEEPRVRKAVSGFVRGVWEEWVEQRDVEMGGKSKDDKERIGMKGIAALLVKWGEALDKVLGDDEDEDEDETEAKRTRTRPEIAALSTGRHKSGGGNRTALAAEALWDELDPVTDWSGILDMLLLDHSASTDQGPSSNGRSKKGKKGRKPAKSKGTTSQDADDDDETESVYVDESWRLEEVEEGVLLELLVASLAKTKKEAVGGKKGEEDAVANEITRALMKGLPRLFMKYQTDENRIKDVLVLPTVMNLDLYLEMRAISDYSNLWDDVLKQFLTHASPAILALAINTITYLLSATSLSNTNSTKILELEDELSSVLRAALAGREEIEVASFNEDEALSLGSTCMRLRILAGTRDMTGWIEDDEGGKQSKVWDLLNAIAERGRLGYKEEEMMIEQVLHLLTLHIIWKGKALTTDPSPSTEEVRHAENLVLQREVLLEKLMEYSIGTDSNTVEGVQRTAFKNLLDLHVLFSATQTVAADGSQLSTATVALTMDDEAQYRCAGYVQAEIERYAEIAQGAEEEDKSDDGSDVDSGDDNEVAKKAKMKGKGKAKSVVTDKEDEDVNSRARLEEEYVFIDVMSTFLRAIRAGAIHVRHGASLLAHYGRLGPTFDLCTKVIVEVLREAGMFNDDGDIVALVITQALQEAFTLILDSVVRDETNAVQLAKQLASCFVIRGIQLSIIRRLDSEYIVQIHTNLISWLGKRLSTYQSNNNKKSLKRTILCFRVLTQMLSVIQSREALQIKAHMDQVLAEAKVEVSPTSSVWEPQRGYERRLTSKDKEKVPGTKTRKAAGKGKAKGSAAMVTTDEESEVEHLVDAARNAEQDRAPVAPRMRKRPQRATASRARARAAEQQSDHDGDDTAEENIVTSKSRPRPRPTYKSKNKSPAKKAAATVDTDKDDTATERPVAPRPGDQTPPQSPLTPAGSDLDDVVPVSRKRARTSEDEEQVAAEAEATAGSATEGGDDEAEGSGYIQVRRKRARH